MFLINSEYLRCTTYYAIGMYVFRCSTLIDATLLSFALNAPTCQIWATWYVCQRGAPDCPKIGSNPPPGSQSHRSGPNDITGRFSERNVICCHHRRGTVRTVETDVSARPCMLHVWTVIRGFRSFPRTLSVQAGRKECLQTYDTAVSVREPLMSLNGQVSVLGFFLSSFA